MIKKNFSKQLFFSARSFITHFCVTFAVICLWLQSSPLAAQNEGGRNISFGTYQADKASTMFRALKPVIDAMNQNINLTRSDKLSISIKIFASYDEGINALVAGHVDFMRTGPASYVLAKKRNPSIKLLVMESIHGETQFNGMIIVPKNSAIKQVVELRGKSFAFGNPNSTLGRYLSQALLVSEGIFAKDLSRYEYLGRHDKVAYAVGLGDYDAGAVKEKAFEKESQKGTIRAIASFKTVTQPWVASAALEKDIFDSLQAALLSLSDKEALKPLKVSGFVATDDARYDFVRNGMQKAQRFTE